MEISGAIKLIRKVLPWLVTALALWIAFRGIEWRVLGDHITSANPSFLVLAIVLTGCSYLARARRWQHLLLGASLSYRNAVPGLFLGFFMNNVLPARAGEFVRAHIGAQATGTTRTLVLASVASERLADGITLSLMFVLFSAHIGNPEIATNLLYVAGLFAVATSGVVALIAFRSLFFRLLRALSNRFHYRPALYLLNRAEIFTNGLAPLCTRRTVPIVALWSIGIWLIELLVFVAIARSFAGQITVSMGIAECVLFMVAVNFSSLIPAAPGGIGVIEMVAGHVLESIGLSRELALTMVLSQHVIQYGVVGIPGAFFMLTWLPKIKAARSAEVPSTAPCPSNA